MRGVIWTLFISFTIAVTCAGCVNGSGGFPAPPAEPADAIKSVPHGKHYNVPFDIKPSQTIYKCGELIETDVTLTNAGNGEPVTIRPFPPLMHIYTNKVYDPSLGPASNLPDPGDMFWPRKVVKTFPAGEGEKVLTNNESAAFHLTWDGKDDSGNQSKAGWHYYDYLCYYGNPVSGLECSVSGQKGFLIQYPQGAMKKVIDVNQTQTIRGLPFSTDAIKTRIDLILCLERVELAENTCGFYMLARSPNNPMPNYIEGWVGAWDHAQYSIDGVIKDAHGTVRHETADGLELTWGGSDICLDPVPSDAKQLTFIMDGLGTWKGPWEFQIPLR